MSALVAELPAGTHLVGLSYLGVHHYDAAGRMFDSVELLERWLRRANGGSGRSGSVGGAEAGLCSCAAYGAPAPVGCAGCGSRAIGAGLQRVDDLPGLWCGACRGVSPRG